MGSLTITDIEQSVVAGESLEPEVMKMFYGWLKRNHPKAVIEFRKHPPLHPLDYLFRLDGYGYCNIEIKIRENGFSEFEETIVPVNKVIEARRQYDEDGLLAFYVAYFKPDNKIGIWDMLQIRKTKRILRKDRNIESDYYLFQIKEALAVGSLKQQNKLL